MIDVKKVLSKGESVEVLSKGESGPGIHVAKVCQKTIWQIKKHIYIYPIMEQIPYAGCGK